MERLAEQRRSPSSRGPGPFIVLGIFALVPALVLYAIFAWADRRVGDSVAAPPPPSTIVDPPLPDEPLRNAVLSFRRLPAVVSRDVNVDGFVSVVAAFGPTLNDRSCTAISVDGNDVGERNKDLPVIPASTQKIVVAAVALDVLGYELISDVAPGEAVFITLDGDIHTRQCANDPAMMPCLFEFVYLARPDSIIDDVSVYKVNYTRSVAAALVYIPINLN